MDNSMQNGGHDRGGGENQHSPSFAVEHTAAGSENRVKGQRSGKTKDKKARKQERKEQVLERKRRPLKLKDGLLEYVFNFVAHLGLFAGVSDLYEFLNAAYAAAEGGLGPSKIEWTDFGWALVVGCTSVSPGCSNCYARSLHMQWHKAFLRDGPIMKNGRTIPKQYHKPFNVVQVLAERLGKPLRTSAPGKVFVNAFSDMFHEDVTLEFLQKAFIIMGACPHLRFQILTKRARRLAQLADKLPWFPNIEIGVTVEGPEYFGRIDDLRKVPAAVRWISAEPLLSSLKGIDLTSVHWVIVGGETAASHQRLRFMHPDWALEIKDACEKFKAAFFYKQTGDGVHESQLEDTGLADKTKGRPVYEWDDGTVSYRFGRVNRHDVLYGKKYKNYPVPTVPVWTSAHPGHAGCGTCSSAANCGSRVMDTGGGAPNESSKIEAPAKVVSKSPEPPASGRMPDHKASTDQADADAEASELIHESRAMDQCAVDIDGLPPMRLIHTGEGQVFAWLKVGERHEALPVDGAGFRDRVQLNLFEHQDKFPSDAKVKAAVAAVRGSGRQLARDGQVFTRVASHDGGLVIDLGTPDGRVVHVTPDDWEILEESPVPFRRGASAGALPAPRSGGDVGDLQALLPLEPRSYAVALGYTLSAFMPTGPYPLLSVTGPAGAGKSTLTDMLKALTDPSSAPRRVLPDDEVALFRAAQTNRVLDFDNVSALSAKLSDALCKLSTGAGLAQAKRGGFGEETVFSACCPAILNGIGGAVTKGDLQQRVWHIDLPPYGEGHRLNEDVLKAELVERGGRAFGLILDMLSAGLRNIDSVRVAGSTRMIKAAQWVAACTAHIGWEPEFFTEYLEELAIDGAQDALEGSPFLSGAVDLVNEAGEFEGTMTELLALIAERNPGLAKLPAPNKASPELSRHVDALRLAGISFVRPKSRGTNGRRCIKLAKLAGPTTATRKSTVTTATDTAAGKPVDWLDWVQIAS